MKMINTILDYLEELFPNPVCELNYKNDYELLISIMLSAQTTDKRVNKVTRELFSKYKSAKELSLADIKDVEDIIRSLGNYTKKSYAVIEIAKKVIEWGSVPKSRNLLLSLPMVGRKTVNVFLSEYYGIPNIAVDTHVDRVSKRLRLAKENANVLEVEHSLQKKIPKDKWVRAHHQLVLFGRYYCKAVKPSCVNCKLTNICKYKEKTR